MPLSASKLLEGVDVIEAFRPDFLWHQVVDSHHQHVFVVGAIEDSDGARFGCGPVAPPQKVVSSLLF